MLYRDARVHSATGCFIQVESPTLTHVHAELMKEKVPEHNVEEGHGLTLSFKGKRRHYFKVKNQEI
jgi:hypothetical protein